MFDDDLVKYSRIASSMLGRLVCCCWGRRFGRNKWVMRSDGVTLCFSNTWWRWSIVGGLNCEEKMCLKIEKSCSYELFSLVKCVVILNLRHKHVERKGCNDSYAPFCVVILYTRVLVIFVTIASITILCII